jgi:hypothetical protein
MNIDDQETLEKELYFPYPKQLITMSDTRTPCKTWEDALKDDSMKKIFDSLTDKEKSSIQKNMKTRECQNVQGSLQCISLNNKFEQCSKMPVEIPNNIKAEMIKIDNLLETQNKTVLNNLDKKVENFRYTLDNLINHHQTRQEMKTMSLTYKQTNLNELGRASIKQNTLGNKVENDQTEKDLIVGKIKMNRNNYNWYINKNYYLTIILKLSLLILTLINVIYLMISKAY